MCEIQWLSDGDLLALMVGPKTAQQLLKEVNGSLAALLLNEAAAAYDPKPKVQAKLKAAR